MLFHGSRDFSLCNFKTLFCGNDALSFCLTILLTDCISVSLHDRSIFRQSWWILYEIHFAQKKSIYIYEICDVIRNKLTNTLCYAWRAATAKVFSKEKEDFRFLLILISAFDTEVYRMQSECRKAVVYSSVFHLTFPSIIAIQEYHTQPSHRALRFPPVFFQLLFEPFEPRLSQIVHSALILRSKTIICNLVMNYN